VPILLLHGQPGRGRDWKPVSDHLGDRMALLAIDRPGWDGSSQPGGFARSAAAAIEALDAADWAHATVVGHSYGAGVAAWLAAERPERVAALLLVAPSANTASLGRIDRLLGVRAVEPLLSPGLILAAHATARIEIIRLPLARALGVDQAWLCGVASGLTHRRAWRSFFVEQRLQIRELPMLEERLARIQAPTTIVIGTRDPTVPLQSAQQLARQISGAELIVIPGGGHTLPVRFPRRLAEIIERVAETAPSPTPSPAPLALAPESRAPARETPGPRAGDGASRATRA
jgi:pimeloyl-ACP methyl ester carboxylesterase